MSLETTFRTSSVLMVLAGALALAFAEASPLSLILAVAGCGVAWVLVDGGRFLVPRSLGVFFAVGALLVWSADFFVLSGDIALSLARFLLLLQIIKLLGEKRDSDWLQIYAISLMHLGVAAIITVDLFFAAIFVLYMVVATWTLTLFHFRRIAAGRGLPTPSIGAAPGLDAAATAAAVAEGPDLAGRSSAAEVGTPLVSAGFFFRTSGVTLFALVGTILFFFLFPRVGVRFMRVPGRGGPRLSGFSESVDIDDIGEIKENPAVVMRVVREPDADGRVRPPPSRGLYLRGIAYDGYDGTGWSRQQWIGRWRQADGLDGGLGRKWRIEPRFRSRWDQDAPRYTVFLTPLDSGVLFTVPTTHSIETAQPLPRSLRLDQLGNVDMGYPRTRDIKYTIEMSPPDRGDAAYLTRTMPTFSTQFDGVDYVTVPDVVDRVRLRALSERVIAEAGAETPYEIATAIERHLATQYRYTLNIERTPGTEPVIDFLFVRKAGHCEYFASAMVLMLRVVGIPARLVNGFHGGEWNSLASYWLIRQKDAHAWVEVPLGLAGWITFDPTPAVASEEESALAPLRRVLDYLQLTWINHVVSYDARQQRDAVAATRTKARSASRSFRDWLESFGGDGADGTPREVGSRRVGVALMALGAVLVLVIGVRRFAGRGGTDPTARVTRRGAAEGDPAGGRAAAAALECYERALAALAAHGLERAAAETPRELARRVAAAAPPDGDEAGGYLAFAELTELYYRVQFGNATPEAASLARAGRICADLERALRAAPPKLSGDSGSPADPAGSAT